MEVGWLDWPLSGDPLFGIQAFVDFNETALRS
jgi:hypothetical protein